MKPQIANIKVEIEQHLRLGDSKVAQIRYGKAKPSNTGTVPVVGSSGTYSYTQSPLVDKPTVVIGRKGTAGAAYFMQEPCWPSDTTFYLDINLELYNPKFLYRFISFKKLTGDHNKTTLPSLKREDLSELMVPAISLKEQQKIIEFLDTFQEATELQEKRNKTLRELKFTLMKELFEKGLLGEEQEEKGNGKFPKSWKIEPLSRISKVERGKFAHRPRNDPEYYGGSIPFIQTGDITLSDGIIRSYSQTLNEKGLSVSRLFPRGTIVITIAANIGYSGILGFDSAFPDSIIGLTPDEKVITKEFLNYYLMTQQPVMDELASKGTQKNINVQFLSPWPVPVPSIPEQQQIVQVLKEIDSNIELSGKKQAYYKEMSLTLLDSLMNETVNNSEVN